MKIILVVATSIDGKITMGDNPDVHAFTSAEDTDFFRKMLSDAKVIVMGRRTYDSMKAGMKHKPERIRVVLTHEPDKYRNEEIEGQLEFTDESPKVLAGRFEKSRYEEVLLVSGADVTTEFFKENLIDEIYLTLEPWVIGAGKPVILQSEINARLELLDMKKLNSRGTLLLHYKIAKN